LWEKLKSDSIGLLGILRLKRKGCLKWGKLTPIENPVIDGIDAIKGGISLPRRYGSKPL
jgi:hypothetical protein